MLNGVEGGGPAAQSDRSWGVGRVGGSQRWSRAIRRLGAHRLLDSRRTALDADGALQRRTPGGYRAGAAANLGALPGPQGVPLGARSGATAAPGGAFRRDLRGQDRLPQRRRHAQGDESEARRSATGVGAARVSLAQQPQRRPHAGLRQEAEDQRQPAERVRTSGTGTHWWFEETLPAGETPRETRQRETPRRSESNDVARRSVASATLARQITRVTRRY